MTAKEIKRLRKMYEGVDPKLNLARDLGIDRHRLMNWERGAITPSPANMDKLEKLQKDFLREVHRTYHPRG
jgi:DNA-binding transcriptional regulator YiaG